MSGSIPRLACLASNDVRFFNKMRNRTLPEKPPEKRGKPWLWNGLITTSVVVAMLGLSRISPELAYGIAALGLLGLGIFFYLAGRS